MASEATLLLLLILAGTSAIPLGAGGSISATVKANFRGAENGWREPRQLTTDLANEVNPYVMRDSSGKIWLLFCSDSGGSWGIWSMTSDDNGNSWSTPTRVSPPLQQYTLRGIGMMGDSARRLWIVWSAGSRAGGDNNLYYVISADGGVTWSNPRRPYSGDAPWGGYVSPSIVEAFGKIWLFFRWYHTDQNREEIMLVTSDDGGTTWSSLGVFVTNPGSDDHPFAFLDSAGKLWVLWSRDYEWAGFNRDIYHKTSDDGANWSPEAQLTSSQASEAFPSMAESVGTLYVFYSYIPDSSSGNIDIWYVTSTDRAKWSSPQQLITEPNAKGWDFWIDPESGSFDGTVWVVWTSNRAGNYDIWQVYAIHTKTTTIITTTTPPSPSQTQTAQPQTATTMQPNVSPFLGPDLTTIALSVLTIGIMIGLAVYGVSKRRRTRRPISEEATQAGLFEVSVGVPSVGKTVTLEVAPDHTLGLLVETLVSTLDLRGDKRYAVEYAGRLIGQPDFGKTLAKLGIKEGSKLSLRVVE